MAKRQIGTDMEGRPVFNGDRVLSFNLKPDLPGPGTWATIRRRGDKIHVYREGTESSTGCVPHDPRYGVLKVEANRG